MDTETQESNTGSEIEAIESLKGKLSPNNSVSFRLSTLDDALEFICTSSFEERKVLLLYLYNSKQPVSKMFSENLGSGELAEILNRSFVVLGWDVEESKYHAALTSALTRYDTLSTLGIYVKIKESGCFCILPINGIISIHKSIQGDITLNDTIDKLKEVEEVFKKENEKELEKIVKENTNENYLGSKRLQRVWADLLGDRDYDGFEYDQHEALKEKIGFSLVGPPEQETGYNDKIKAQIEKLYNVIKSESDKIAESRDKIEISIIYNCLEPLPKEKTKRKKIYSDYDPETDVNPVPIYILRKCRESSNPCRIFIDETGRVYQNWKSYLTKNRLPECEMIVPRNGRYQVKNEKVSLEYHLSPACHYITKLLQVGDGISTTVGISSGAVFLTAAIPAIPVAAPLLLGAWIAGVGTALWAIGRSVGILVDRGTHKESMSFANSEARGVYLNIVSGSLGLLYTGVNIGLKQSVRSGDNIKPRRIHCINIVGVLNIGASGVSLANSGYEVFDQWRNKKQVPSVLTWLQLGASVLFFGHAVYSFKGAQRIIAETQASVLQDFQDTLRSTKEMKIFNEFMEEALRNHDDGTKVKAEVIRAIRNNQFSIDGTQVKLNDFVLDLNDGFNKKQTETFLSNLFQQCSSQPSAPANIPISCKTAILKLLTVFGICKEVAPRIYQFLQKFGADIGTKIVNAVETFALYVFRKLRFTVLENMKAIIPNILQLSEFLRLSISYFSKLVDEFEENYQKYQQTRAPQYYNPLFEAVNLLYGKRTLQFFQYVVNNFSENMPSSAALEEFFGNVSAWITSQIDEHERQTEYEERRSSHSEGFRVKRVDCSVCGGHYFNRA